MRQISNNQGFTLLELLIYVAILGAVTVIVSQSYILFSKSRAQIESRAQVNSDLRFAMEQISRDVEQATAVALPATPGATSSQISLTVGGQSVSYTVLSGQLQRQVGANAPENLNSSSTAITSLTSTRLENINQALAKNKISIQFILEGQSSSASPDWQAIQIKQSSASLIQYQ